MRPQPKSRLLPRVRFLCHLLRVNPKGSLFDIYFSEPQGQPDAHADRELFDFTLRVAYLADLTSHAAPSKPRTLDQAPIRPATAVHKSSSSTTRQLWTRYRSTVSSLISESKDSVGKEGAVDQFPSAASPVIRARLLAIASGHDREHTDPLLRKSAQAFSNYLTEGDFLGKFVRRKGAVGELILAFAQVASNTLRIENQFSALQVNAQVSLFVSVLRQAVSNLPGTSPQLMASLDSRFADRTTASDPSTVLPRMPTRVEEMEMVSSVGRLFQLSTETLQAEVDQIKSFCTEKVRDHLTSTLYCWFRSDSHCFLLRIAYRQPSWTPSFLSTTWQEELNIREIEATSIQILHTTAGDTKPIHHWSNPSRCS